MSDRFLVFSDYHIHNHSGDWRRVDDALVVLDWILQTAISKQVDKVFFLGDFFHVRGYMYPTIVARAYKALTKFRENGIEMYMLIGNHDMPNKFSTKNNSLTAFSDLVNVIEQPMVLEGTDWNFYWLPYVERLEQVGWAIDKILGEKDPTKKSCLLGHLDIKGAKYHPYIEATAGIDYNSVSACFDMVLTGHYHTHQQVSENVWYIGSPYQQSFGETGEKKGIMLFDNGSLEFIENTFSPKYMYITSGEVNESIKDNYVSISVTDSNQIVEIREQANSFNPRNVNIKVDRAEHEENQQLVMIKQDAKDVGALLKEWIAKTANPTIFDHAKLFSTGMSIVEESK